MDQRVRVQFVPLPGPNGRDYLVLAKLPRGGAHRVNLTLVQSRPAAARRGTVTVQTPWLAVRHDPTRGGGLPDRIEFRRTGKVFEKWGATWPMFVGMVIVAASCVPLVLSDANTGLGLVVTALGVTAIGQGLAYNISTTAAMNAVTDDKAGLASGVISAIRMVALVFGIAVSGFVFKVFETDGYDNAVAAAGGQLSSADKSEIQGLLAGSDEAAQKLTELSPATADQVEGIVRVAFTDGLSAAFILNFVVAVIGVAGALLGRKRHVPEKPDETDDSSGVMIRSPYHSIPIARTADMTIGT